MTLFRLETWAYENDEWRKHSTVAERPEGYEWTVERAVACLFPDGAPGFLDHLSVSTEIPVFEALRAMSGIPPYRLESVEPISTDNSGCNGDEGGSF